MNTKYGRKRASIILNALIFICEIAGFTMEISAEMFVYYTNLSNFTAAVACLLMLLNLFCGFSGRSGNAVWGLKYMATCMTTITLCVVACILVPMQGIQMLYAGNFLVFHLVCPILMLVSFLLFDPVTTSGRKNICLGIVPTLIYAVAAVICNCIGVLDGPYPFLKVRDQPIYISLLWGVVVLGAAWLIAYMLLRLKRQKTG